MRILLVTHYFPPEIGASQTRLVEVGASLIRRGHDVTVVAPLPHYPVGAVLPGYRRTFLKRERIDGVPVIRTWVYAVPNDRPVRRLVDFASFGATALVGASRAGPADVVVAQTPPLPPGLAGVAISKAKRCPFVCSVADLWLASAIGLGVVTRKHAIRAGRALERSVYRRAARLTAVTQGVRDGLLAYGVEPARVDVIPNGADTSRFRPDLDPGAWRQRLAGDGRFVVLYAGNIGLAQGLEIAVDAAARLGAGSGVRFVLVGDGADRRRLQALATSRGLDSIAFLPPQARSEMPQVLAAADAALVSLRDAEIFRGAVPAKTSEAMAAGRPVLLAAAGEAADLVARAGAGLCVTPGSADELAAAVLRLRDDPGLRGRLGTGGRRFAEEHLDRELLVDRFERVLVEAAG